MAGFDPAFQHELVLNTSIMFIIGILIITLRFYAQICRVGLKGFQADDYLMILAALSYTALIICLNVIAAGGGSNLALPGEYSTFTQQDIKERTKGSKVVVGSEQAMLITIYLVKLCVLFVYGRMTAGTQVVHYVRYLAVYVIIGFIATEIAFFTACIPFTGYWAVPPPNPQCTTLQHYSYVQATFNISSDCLMLAVPLPMIFKLKLPLKQKIILGGVFSMGIFVIVAAICTKVFNLSNVYDTSYMLWYTREASVAVYVANLPLIWPLLRGWIPFLRGNNTDGQNTDALPTVEPLSKRSRTIGREVSMKAFLDEGPRSTSMRSLTREDRSSADYTLAEKQDIPFSCIGRRSSSRGRTLTKETMTDATSRCSIVDDGRSFSGISQRDGQITAETTIHVESFLLRNLSNSSSDRRKYQLTPRSSHLFEANQVTQALSREITIEGGAAPAPHVPTGPRLT